MSSVRIPCLILACGNTLRGDDGIGPHLAAWAEDRFRQQPGVRVLSRHLWMPEMVEEIANADTVLFLDSSAQSEPGVVQLIPVTTAEISTGLSPHHLDPGQLLSLCQELYCTTPAEALLLTIGMGGTELGAGFSDPLQCALPQACALLEATVRRFLNQIPQP